eukprot:6197018-Alexandrium_andersonii.AAC.1
MSRRPRMPRQLASVGHQALPLGHIEARGACLPLRWAAGVTTPGGADLPVLGIGGPGVGRSTSGRAAAASGSAASSPSSSSSYP